MRFPLDLELVVGTAIAFLFLDIEDDMSKAKFKSISQYT